MASKNKHVNIMYKSKSLTAVSIPDGATKRTMITDTSFYKLNDNWKCALNEYGYCRFKGTMYHQFVMGDTTGDGKTVDHYNRQPLDNRRANLHFATKREQRCNQGTRCDKMDAPEELRLYGISKLPKCVRYDAPEQKFTFTDHSYIDKLKSIGVHVNGSGTKAAANSLPQKLKHCLVNIIDMYEKHRVHFPEDVANEAALSAKRRELVNEYNDIVNIAHDMDPENFFDGPVDLADFRDEVDIANDMLVALADVTDYVVGPGEYAHAVGEATAYCTRVSNNGGNDVVTLFDRKYLQQLSPPFNWNAGDRRIYVSPSVHAMYPAIAELFPGDYRIRLSEFVYHILERNPIVPGHFIVQFNHMKDDVRVENLMYLEGTTRNYKKPSYLQSPPGFDIGMKYFPRGVYFSEDTKNKGQLLQIKSKTDRTIKVCVTKTTVAAKFATKVLPVLMERDPDFVANNAKYQRLMSDFEAVSPRSTV